MMSQRESEEFHRETARKCFNEAWSYLEKKNRDDRDDEHMLHLSHAARYHRTFGGTDRDFAIDDWQISRVYAALDEPRLAMQFARSSLDRIERNNLSDILCMGYEAMARACNLAREFDLATDYIKRAREELAKSNADDEDRRMYSDQIQETELLLAQ